MKKKSTVIYLFIAIILISLQTACQDRLIVLWDEGIKPLLVMDSMQIIEGQDAIDEGTTTQAQGSQSESPVDIIMVIDASGSMSEELTKVQTYINQLSQAVGNSGFDYRFIMIAPKGEGPFQITVPKPLGTSSRFMHVDTQVESTDAFEKVLECYSSQTDSIYDGYWTGCSAYYKNFLRSNALLNIIVVSDDNARDPYLVWKDTTDINGNVVKGFKSAMATYIKADFTLHGIIGLTSGLGISSVGQEYIKGINATGGVKCEISTTSNWGTLFDQISANIIQQIPPTNTYQLDDNVFLLGGTSAVQSIVVSIDGGVINSNDWQYNSSNNTIEFLDTNLLHDGANISVSYLLQEEVLPGMVYFLENEPIIKDEDNPEASFKVWINTNEIQSPGNWKYVKGSNSIHFLIPALLHDGGDIQVEYKTMP